MQCKTQCLLAQMLVDTDCLNNVGWRSVNVWFVAASPPLLEALEQHWDVVAAVAAFALMLLRTRYDAQQLRADLEDHRKDTERRSQAQDRKIDGIAVAVQDLERRLFGGDGSDLGWMPRIWLELNRTRSRDP